jgi:transposase
MKTSEKLYANYVGVDISKETIDVSVLRKGQKNLHHHQFNNGPEGFEIMENWLIKQPGFSYSKSLFCMEHTGIYTRQLHLYLLNQKTNVWIESSLQIKKSLGLNRGKNDKIDSKRIAEYACRFTDKVNLEGMYEKNLQKLKDFLSSRDRLNKALKSIQVSIKELVKIDHHQGQSLMELNLPAIDGIKQSIKVVEASMEKLIMSDERLRELFVLSTSIPGVGSILTMKLMVYTHAFTKFETTRQLACYCGVAPFEYRSGTSIRGKTGVSKFANIDMKSTLHLAAMSSIQHNPELKKYFERKVKEGKSKMSVLNAVRNKLLNRIVAVIKRGTPYVKLNQAA